MKEFTFVIEGRPKVQKNDLKIYGAGKRKFIGHSAQLTKIRVELGRSAYEQFVEQGGKEPIDYLCEMDFTFYHGRQWEPDLDNLPSIVLDAIQGESVKGVKGLKINAILKDDKIVRKIVSEKIIDGDPKYNGEPRTEFTIKEYIL